MIFSACFTNIKGEGPEKTQERNISVFTELTVKVPANITLVISDSVKCAVTAQDNIQQEIKVENDGDELIIKTDHDINVEKPVEIVLSVPSVEKISVHGSGNLNVINTIRGNELKLDIGGSGNMNVQADVSDLRTVINGSGDMNLTGKTSEHKAQINGSGNLHAKGLNSEVSDIRINGSGDAEVNVGKDLSAKIVGSGNLIYCGTPEVHSNITGSGGVSKCK